MNTNRLKKFAQETRKKLLEQVSAKVDYVITADSAELREKAALVATIKDEIRTQGKQQLVDKVAYTWFNRFVALRYMDVNDYQPLDIKIVSALPGQVSPQILQEALAGHIPQGLNINEEKVFGLIDGRIESKNAENNAYRLLLIGACNYLNKIFPFLFERIDDYTELLLPDDLTSQFSTLHHLELGIIKEDCYQVEVIGWLYQFYISEKKEELINAKKQYKPDELAPVTQLFTPKWIVKYMVENTLGQFQMEVNSDSNVTSTMEFYIKPQDQKLIPSRARISPEDIKFFDPCVGSAHILCYAFDIFYKIYEEEGYNPIEIPELIIRKNLFGIDIDDRAAQLAGFALMMKGRQYNKRIFKEQIIPNVLAFQNSNEYIKFEDAKILGSLTQVTKSDLDKIKIDESSLFAESNKHLKRQAELLSNKYDIIVTNPPYLNSAYMDATLKKFVEKEYKDTKSDLFACFLTQVSNLTKKDGLIGFICPYVWMFNQSYEKLRNYILNNTSISSLIQLEYNAFGPAVVPICTFVLRNQCLDHLRGSYIRLSEFTGVENQEPKTLEAIQNPNCQWFYISNQTNFQNIPGKAMGYWLSEKAIQIFSNKSLKEIARPRIGMRTGDNLRFLRLWHEVENSKSPKLMKSSSQALESKGKWFPYNKGGDFRKWYGNNFYLVNWEDDGNELKSNTLRHYPQLDWNNLGWKISNEKFYFKSGITWTALSSGKFGCRYSDEGFLFDTKGSSLFPTDANLFFILSFLLSKSAQSFLDVFCPTMDYNIGGLGNIPILETQKLNLEINELSKENVSISRLDWNSRETSWDFRLNELLKHKAEYLEEAYDLYKQYWENKFFKLHENEEKLNTKFNEIYGLQDELTSKVLFEDITILNDETKIANGEIIFNGKEVMSQFVSYAVGCMLGRYSLDKDGLILANHGETVQDYFNNIGKPEIDLTFAPDKDNIIPILEDDWFEDDVSIRFHQFLKAIFGEKDFQKNLAFLEDQLGCSVRKYFTREFYLDHIQRYKKRPIYWMFSSPKRHFNVLIYMHRHTPDTLNLMLNYYLRTFIEKLKVRMETLKHSEATGSPAEKTKALKEMDKISVMLLDCHDYERNILYPLATERIAINLDNGVLVNYNCFGKAVKEVAGLNDSITKKKVKEFDWIDPQVIR